MSLGKIAFQRIAGDHSSIFYLTFPSRDKRWHSLVVKVRDTLYKSGEQRAAIFLYARRSAAPALIHEFAPIINSEVMANRIQGNKRSSILRKGRTSPSPYTHLAFLLFAKTVSLSPSLSLSASIYLSLDEWPVRVKLNWKPRGNTTKACFWRKAISGERETSNIVNDFVSSRGGGFAR